MSTFHLKISTPDGLLFDGEVERVRARMIDGAYWRIMPIMCLLSVRARPLLLLRTVKCDVQPVSAVCSQ